MLIMLSYSCLHRICRFGKAGKLDGVRPKHDRWDGHWSTGIRPLEGQVDYMDVLYKVACKQKIYAHSSG